MKYNKRWASLFAVCALALGALTGCSSDNSSASSDE